MTTSGLITKYFDGEGRPYMGECLTEAFQWCTANGIQKLVVFTGNGAGPMFATEHLLPFHTVKMIAVSPPAGRPFSLDPNDPNAGIVTAGVPEEMADYLRAFGVPVIASHLPLRPLLGQPDGPLQFANKSIELFGAGIALCVQAILMACDAGAIHEGERVVAATADSALSAIASRTEGVFAPHAGMLVEHIICRPRRFPISRPRSYAPDEDGAVKALSAMYLPPEE